MIDNMHPAAYSVIHNERVRCHLCPHNCMLAEGQYGICRARCNINGVLMSANYGKVTAMHFDPIEKKPLYHFYPGAVIFSLGTAGCNFNCDFCQNCEISQVRADDYPFIRMLDPRQAVQMAMQNKQNIGIAYTYNEPSIWFEYVLDTAKLAQAAGLKNVMVSNGFINTAPLNELLPWIDAFNIDLKAFTEEFYSKYTGGQLAPVKNTLKQISRHGRHLEITCLVIPGLNDDTVVFRKMAAWISAEVGKNTVLHLSRYFPRNRMSLPPTTEETLLRLRETAKEYLHYVYVGNLLMEEGASTYCYSCGNLVIERNGYLARSSGLDQSGKCMKCSAFIAMR